MPYTHAQMISQALTPKPSAILSIMGSAAMLLEIHASRSKAGERTRAPRRASSSGSTAAPSHSRSIDRLLAGMCISDLSFSAGWFLTTWPSPSENSSWLWGASGNTGTCSAQAFFISLGFWGTPLYNTVVSFYYRAIIEWGWADERLLKYDKFVHLAIWSALLLRSFVYLAKTYFNPYGVICYVTAWPPDCTGEDCVRGDENAWKVAIFEQLFPIWPCLFLNAYFMARMYRSVRRVADRSSRSRLASGGLSEQLRHVKRQALLYVFAMYFCLVPDQIYALIYFTSPARTFFNFWFETFVYMALPLQGYLNFLVFMRRRRKAHSSFGHVMMAPLRWMKDATSCWKRLTSCGGSTRGGTKHTADSAEGGEIGVSSVRAGTAAGDGVSRSQSGVAASTAGSGCPEVREEASKGDDDSAEADGDKAIRVNCAAENGCLEAEADAVVGDTVQASDKLLGVSWDLVEGQHSPCGTVISGGNKSISETSSKSEVTWADGS